MYQSLLQGFYRYKRIEFWPKSPKEYETPFYRWGKWNLPQIASPWNRTWKKWEIKTRAFGKNFHVIRKVICLSVPLSSVEKYGVFCKNYICEIYPVSSAAVRKYVIFLVLGKLCNTGGHCSSVAGCGTSKKVLRSPPENFLVGKSPEPWNPNPFLSPNVSSSLMRIWCMLFLKRGLVRPVTLCSGKRSRFLASVSFLSSFCSKVTRLHPWKDE